MAGHNIAIVGATGAVGLKILQVLNEQVKDIANLRLFASERSAGKKITFRNKEIVIENLENAHFKGLDVVFFSAGAEISRIYSQKVIASGAVVIDNTNAFRMEEDVPLVIPEVNPHAIKCHKGLISNPNCSTIQMLIAIAPIHRINPIKRIVVSTYQSVSGTGLKAVEILKNQCQAMLDGKEIPLGIYPHQIAFNLIPQIDVPLESGLYREEEKMVRETCKILESDIPVCPTAVRVPIINCHSESVNLELTDSYELADIRKLLASSQSIILIDNHYKSKYPTPLNCQDRDEVFIGRIRRDDTIINGLNMWVVSDNLRSGAATNAVRIFNRMVADGLL